jgi:hypothetical protein
VIDQQGTGHTTGSAPAKVGQGAVWAQLVAAFESLPVFETNARNTVALAEIVDKAHTTSAPTINVILFMISPLKPFRLYLGG